MSNFTNNNLIAVTPADVPVGSLSAKIGGLYFVAANAVSQATGFYKCASVDTISHTWTGYKYLPDMKVFEQTVTNGLSYTALPPAIGKTYTHDGTIEINQYIQDGLVFYASLSAAMNYAETGQPLGNLTNDITYQTHQGVPCAYFGDNPNNGIYCDNVTGFPSGTSARTVSLWVNPASASGNDGAVFSYGEASPNRRFSLGITSSSVNVWGHSNSTTYSHTFTIGEWTHICVTYSSGAEQMFIDGVSIGSQTHSGLDTYPLQAMIGNDANESNPPYAKTYVYLAGVRLYNRVLSQSEISMLADEFASHQLPQQP